MCIDFAGGVRRVYGNFAGMSGGVRFCAGACRRSVAAFAKKSKFKTGTG